MPRPAASEASHLHRQPVSNLGVPQPRVEEPSTEAQASGYRGQGDSEAKASGYRGPPGKQPSPGGVERAQPLGQLVQQPTLGVATVVVGKYPFPPEPPGAPVARVEQPGSGQHRVGVASNPTRCPGQTGPKAAASKASGTQEPGAGAKAVGPKAKARGLPGPPVSLPDQLRQAELLAGFWNDKAQAIRQVMRRQQAARGKAPGGQPGPETKDEQAGDA